MAHIFKHPSGSRKGIIVFTHKEVRFFRGGRGGRFPQILGYGDRLRKIKEKYFVGIHFGWLVNFDDFYNTFDFLMATESVVSGLQEKCTRLVIPLRSRDFTPPVFNNEDSRTKFWDILCISNNSRKKHLSLFLRELRKTYQAGHRFRVLLISPIRKNERWRIKFYRSLESDYVRDFTQAERDLFTLLRPGVFHGFLGLPQTALSHYYKSSKVFTLFSEVEGGPKVVSEALLCGLKVVVKENLRGGGRDYLNDNNAVFFNDFGVAWKALVEAVEGYAEYRPDIEQLRENLGEERSLAKLREYFSILFEQSGSTFDGDLIDTDSLNLKLPAHMVEGIPWGAGRHRTSDILTGRQFSIFLQHLRL